MGQGEGFELQPNGYRWLSGSARVLASGSQLCDLLTPPCLGARSISSKGQGGGAIPICSIYIPGGARETTEDEEPCRVTEKSLLLPKPSSPGCCREVVGSPRHKGHWRTPWGQEKRAGEATGRNPPGTCTLWGRVPQGGAGRRHVGTLNFLLSFAGEPKTSLNLSFLF